MELLAGVLKTSGDHCVEVSCGADGCEGDHPTYPVEDVVIIPEGVPRESFDDEELLARMVAEHKFAVSATTVYPTILGIWWEAVCDN